MNSAAMPGQNANTYRERVHETACIEERYFQLYMYRNVYHIVACERSRSYAIHFCVAGMVRRGIFDENIYLEPYVIVMLLLHM